MINDKFHMSSKRNESVCQETKHEVCFGDESTIAVVVLFTKKGLYVNTSLLLSKCFNDITRNGITRLYRCHPFTILNDDLFNFLMK